MSHRPELVIFDLDGTLIRSQLDFDSIRREIGLGQRFILESIAEMERVERARAEAILARHEDAAAETAELMPCADSVLNTLHEAGCKLALMTRNSRRSVERFLRRWPLPFDAVRTREDGAYKPSPEPVLAICRQLGETTDRTWVVGDFHFDVLCGNAAGATTVLFIDGDGPPPAWAGEARHVIRRLAELPGLFRAPRSGGIGPALQ